MPVTPVQRKELRARAHALKPVILVGDAGLSDAVLAEADRALHDHELIKVRLPALERELREQMAVRLCERLGAEQIQATGHVRVIFRANPVQSTEPGQAERPIKKSARAGQKRKPDRARK